MVLCKALNRERARQNESVFSTKIARDSYNFPTFPAESLHLMRCQDLHNFYTPASTFSHQAMIISVAPARVSMNVLFIR